MNYPEQTVPQEIKGPYNPPTPEDIAWTERKSEALAETPEVWKERYSWLTSLAEGRMDYVSHELKLDAAPGINRVPLTFEKRFEYEVEMCRLLGKTHPLAATYTDIVASPEYDEILEQEAVWRSLGILQRGL